MGDFGESLSKASFGAGLPFTLGLFLGVSTTGSSGGNYRAVRAGIAAIAAAQSIWGSKECVEGDGEGGPAMADMIVEEADDNDFKAAYFGMGLEGVLEVKPSSDFKR